MVLVKRYVSGVHIPLTIIIPLCYFLFSLFAALGPAAGSHNNHRGFGFAASSSGAVTISDTLACCLKSLQRFLPPSVNDEPSGCIPSSAPRAGRSQDQCSVD